MKSIKRFKSREEYDAWKASDGWDYPSVGFIETSDDLEESTQFNKEFVMRWYDADVAKKPTFFGNITIDEFREWVDNAWSPCEMRKNGKDFNYLFRNNTLSTAQNYQGTETKGSSNIRSGDATRQDFLQLVELKNINVGLFQNSVEGYKEVRFNFDKGCPEGFHRWFAHPYWNESIEAYTKLVGRYDIMPAIGSTTVSISEGLGSNNGTGNLCCCYFPAATDGSQNFTGNNNPEWYCGNWSAQLLLNAIRDLGESQGTTYSYMDGNQPKKCSTYQPWTYWEQLVLVYIAAAYYGSFDIQSGSMENYGLTNIGTSAASLNGSIETLLPGYIDFNNTWSYNKTGEGGTTNKIDITKPAFRRAWDINAVSGKTCYDFMGIENALHGKQALYCSGWGTNGSNYYISFNDIRDSEEGPMLSVEYADKTLPLENLSAVESWIRTIDLYGMPTQVGASSTTGFYDTCTTPSSNTNAREVVALCGGDCGSNKGAGLFNIDISKTSSTQSAFIRGRLTVLR